MHLKRFTISFAPQFIKYDLILRQVKKEIISKKEETNLHYKLNC